MGPQHFMQSLSFCSWCGMGEKCHMSTWDVSLLHLQSFLYRTLTWGSPSSSLFTTMNPPTAVSQLQGFCGLL